jgi:exosome complex component RRP41
MMPRSDAITLLQMDGDMTEDEVEEALKLAKQGCQQVYEMQKAALVSKYSGGDE